MSKKPRSIRVKEGATAFCDKHQVWVGVVNRGRLERYSSNCDCQPVDMTFDPPAEILK